jgi:hypothetical protein
MKAAPVRAAQRQTRLARTEEVPAYDSIAEKDCVTLPLLYRTSFRPQFEKDEHGKYITEKNGGKAIRKKVSRLMSESQGWMLLYLCEKLWSGRKRKRGKLEPVETWTKPITNRLMASECGCDEHTILTIVDDAVERGLISARKEGNGYRYALLVRNWESAPFYERKPRVEAAAEEPVEDPPPAKEAPASAPGDRLVLPTQPPKR